MLNKSNLILPCSYCSLFQALVPIREVRRTFVKPASVPSPTWIQRGASENKGTEPNPQSKLPRIELASAMPRPPSSTATCSGQRTLRRPSTPLPVHYPTKKFPGVSSSLQTCPFLRPTVIQLHYYCRLLQPTLPRISELTYLDSTDRRTWIDDKFKFYEIFYPLTYQYIYNKVSSSFCGLFSLRRPINVSFGDETDMFNYLFARMDYINP